jgi:hypothetical protein
VTVTGNVLYKTRPVATTQNQIPGTPTDTLIPGNDFGQVLGIFTSTGDIQINNQQVDGNLEIDGSSGRIGLSAPLISSVFPPKRTRAVGVFACRSFFLHQQTHACDAPGNLI